MKMKLIYMTQIIKDDKKVERSNKSKSRKRGPKKARKGNHLGTNSIKKIQ